jgi:hypothetical protein
MRWFGWLFLTLTVLFFISTDVKKTQQMMQYGSRHRFSAASNSIITGSRRSEMRRTIRSIRHDFPNARPVPHRSAPIGLTALSERTQNEQLESFVNIIHTAASSYQFSQLITYSLFTTARLFAPQPLQI